MSGAEGGASGVPDELAVAQSYLGSMGGAMAATGLAAVALSYMCSSQQPVVPPISLDNQSREVSAMQRMRMSRMCVEGKLMEYLYEDCQTLYDVIYRGARESNNGRCMGWRPPGSKEYKFIHYNQVLERVKKMACGLLTIGEKPGQDTKIGLYSQNCPEAIITEQACYYFSMVLVPIYDTYGVDACSFIINQTDIETVVCDSVARMENLLQMIENTPNLKRIVYFQDITDDLTNRFTKLGIKLLKMTEVEALGEKDWRHPIAPRRHDLAVVCYTSGTTGNPKGVMLTHGNIMACISGVMFQLGEMIPTKDDVMISYLPLAHMLERCCEMGLYMVGACVGFFSGDIRELTDDMKALKPTMIPTVPRMLNRIYDRVMSAASSSFVKQTLLNWALSSKQAELKKYIIRNNSIWDKIVFRAVRENTGGRVRLMVAGSAPLAANVITMMRCALGAVIVEGYGQTEATAPCTLTFPGDYSTGHVGPPLAVCAIKLVDVPDMEKFVRNGEGEICVKGPIVFKGYYKDPEKTAEVLDDEGWLHTGDIGKWNENGCLMIVDRKKHIFKLSQGEYVAPEKLENIFIRSPFVAQIFVHGESLKSCLVAVVVPEEEYLMTWAKQNSIAGTFEELCRNQVVKKSILDDLNQNGKQAGLKSFELLKDIHIHSELFTVLNGLLTPTMKTKRPECRKFFASQIERMYRTLV